MDEATGACTDELYKFDVSSDASYNQRRYEALGEVITVRVYQLLLDMGLHKLRVPESAPEGDSSFVFASKPDVSKSEKLLLLIHGSGVVRAGQWSRSLIINHSLDHGTQIPYIKRALESGYDVLVANTNQNFRANRKPITGSSSPTEHARTVWQSTLNAMADVKSFAIVAHSFGGVVTVDLASKYADVFQQKCFGVAFTDSVHSIRTLPSSLLSKFQSIGCNWVTSSKPLDTALQSPSADIPHRSAGHVKHEWTSWACIDALFPFLEDNFAKFKRDEL